MKDAQQLGDASGWLIDVEGTLVVDKAYRPVPGAVEWIAALQGQGVPLAILTNNTTMTPAELTGRLGEVGFAVGEDRIVSAQQRLVEILLERGGPECWLLGSPALRRTLEAAGLRVRELGRETPGAEERARALVLGWLENPDGALMSRAVELLSRPSTRFVTLHRNRLFRNAGRLELGLGAWATALEYATGKEAEMAGKPSPELFLAGARVLGREPRQVTMVGDDPHADLLPARKLGMRTILVLSGKYTDGAILEEVPPGLRPDLVVGSVNDLRSRRPAEDARTSG